MAKRVSKKKAVQKKTAKKPAVKKNVRYLVIFDIDCDDGHSESDHAFVTGEEDLLEYLLGCGSPEEVNEFIECGSIMIFDIDNYCQESFKLHVECNLKRSIG